MDSFLQIHFLVYISDSIFKIHFSDSCFKFSCSRLFWIHFFTHFPHSFFRSIFSDSCFRVSFRIHASNLCSSDSLFGFKFFASFLRFICQIFLLQNNLTDCFFFRPNFRLIYYVYFSVHAVVGKSTWRIRVYVFFPEQQGPFSRRLYMAGSAWDPLATRPSSRGLPRRTLPFPFLALYIRGLFLAKAASLRRK